MRIVERVLPDERLVSQRAAVPVFSLSEPNAPLPDSRVFYRTRASGLLFAFTVVRWSDGTYRAYIRQQPGYGARPSGGGVTHRNGDLARRPYVCWSPSPRSARDVLKVARHWAEKTDGYIRTGAAIGR